MEVALINLVDMNVFVGLAGEGEIAQSMLMNVLRIHASIKDDALIWSMAIHVYAKVCNF